MNLEEWTCAVKIAGRKKRKNSRQIYDLNFENADYGICNKEIGNNVYDF